jgi:hypothetical protein
VERKNHPMTSSNSPKQKTELKLSQSPRSQQEQSEASEQQQEQEQQQQEKDNSTKNKKGDSTANKVSPSPWTDGNNSNNTVSDDPTLPMARVYLKLLAESQQEAAMLKRRVFELTNEVVLLKSMLNDKERSRSSTEKEEEVSGARAPESMHQFPPTNQQVNATNNKSATLPQTEFMNGYNSARENMMRMSAPEFNPNDLYQTTSSLFRNKGPSSGGGGVVNGEALALQHAARQAQLRQQYDMLRSQLAASRRNADTYGRFASMGHYTKLTDVEKHLKSRGPTPLSMEEAMRKVENMI